jgi:hypothetical protein
VDSKELRQQLTWWGSGILLVGPFLPFFQFKLLGEYVNIAYFKNHLPYVLALGVASLVLSFMSRHRLLLLTGAAAAAFVLYDIVGVGSPSRLHIGAPVLVLGAALVFAAGLIPDPPARRRR